MTEKETVLTKRLLNLYHDIGNNLPDNQERAQALLKLQECRMWMIQGLNIVCIPPS